MLAAALPALKQRTDLDTLYTDGAYGGPQSDPVLREQQVTLIQTAIVGPKPDPAKLHLADFAITQDAQGLPLTITCPQGQTVPVTPGRKPERFVADFTSATCETCPLYVAGQCPPQPDHRRRNLRLTFNQAEVAKSQRHQRSRATQGPEHNRRAAIEATVRSVKQPFPAGKLPVRGLFRMTCLIVASAAMTNVRRIQRYRQSTRPAVPERPENRRTERPQHHRGPRYSLGTAPTAHFSATLLAVVRFAFLPVATYRPRLSY